jgi:hypothetical protein
MNFWLAFLASQNPPALSQSLILNDVITALGSVIVTAFVLGVRWGAINTSLREIDKRLSKIETMFEMVPKNLVIRGEVREKDALP